MKSKGVINKAIDGKWYKRKMHNLTHICCDCDVKHLWDFKIIEGDFYIKVKRLK